MANIINTANEGPVKSSAEWLKVLLINMYYYNIRSNNNYSYIFNIYLNITKKNYKFYFPIQSLSFFLFINLFINTYNNWLFTFFLLQHIYI